MASKEILKKKLIDLIPKKHRKDKEVLKELNYISKQDLYGYYLRIKEKGIEVKNTCNSWIAYLIGVTSQKPTSELAVESGYADPPD